MKKVIIIFIILLSLLFVYMRIHVNNNNNYKEERPLPEYTRRRQQGDAQTRYKMRSVTRPRRTQT